MKFVHIADMHFDSPFVNLSDREILGDLRRLEQRKVFKKVIEYVKSNDIKYLFISGDLYEHKYVKMSTIEYINKLFAEIPNTNIFISPGNHDPFIKNSYYNKFNWSKNVKIFNSKIEKVETEDANIYGFGFDDFYCTDCGIESLKIGKSFNNNEICDNEEVDNKKVLERDNNIKGNKEKPNILVIHGTLNGASIEEKQYNSMQKSMLNEKGFDYIAMGHIHKLDYNNEENQKIIYPGSTVALGFDELGEHGMIVGNIEKQNINQSNISIEFIPLDEEMFNEIEIDVTEIYSKEDLIEKINDLDINNNEYIKIILNGNRNFEIDRYDILKYVLNDRIIKIKDYTKIAYDLEKMSNEKTLKGLFVKKMLEKMGQEEISKEEKEIIEKAIEIGLDALS